jgi:hypothetical protein
MAQYDPPILGYAAPAPATGFVCAPKWAIMLVAVLVPGLASALIRGLAGVLTMGVLWAAVVLAFIFFGPIWGEFLFRNSSLKEAGLYPFLGTCIVVELTSAGMALRDRRRVLDRGSIQMTEHCI